jgi:guanine deaminase
MITAFRGTLLHFTRDPGDSMSPPPGFIEDGLLVVEDGRIKAAGPALGLLPTLPAGTAVTDYSGRLILPGFIDTHIHYVQTDVIAVYASQLLDWLEDHTFPAERRFEDPGHAGETARFFLDELLRNGTTTALIFGSVHAASAEAFFAEASRRNLRMIAGKALMDRNCPDYLRDTAESGYRDSSALIEKWDGHDRLNYAITPRFAATSTPEQLMLAGKLAREHPDTFIQSHVAENVKEVEWVRSLFPEARSYLDVYDRYGLLPTAGAWPRPARSRRLARRPTCSSAADCSTSPRRSPPACAWRWRPTSAAAPASACCAP